MTWHFQNLSHGFQNLKQRDISERSSWRKELGGLWYVVHESAQRAGSPKFPIWPGFLGARYLVNKKIFHDTSKIGCSSLGGIGSFLNRQKTTKKNLMEFGIRSTISFCVTLGPWVLLRFIEEGSGPNQRVFSSLKKKRTHVCLMFLSWRCFQILLLFCVSSESLRYRYCDDKAPPKNSHIFCFPPPKYSILSFKFVDDKIFHLTPPRWRLQTSIWSRGDFTAFNHHLSPLQLGAASMKPMVGRNGRPFNWKIRWEYGRFSLKSGDIFLFLFEHFNI